MLARGLQTKQVARALGISVKTADRHVQNAYRKIGVSTPRRGDAVRDGARAHRMGRTPDGAARRAAVASPLHRHRTPRRYADDHRDDRSTRSPRRSRPHGSAAGPRSRSSQPRSASGCCASSAPHTGDVVLELAAGVGDTGFDAAALLGERGRLISSDFSPAMLAAARRRGAERGVGNVEYRVDRRRAIELAEDSVDGVLCRFGYMLMDDPGRARRDPPGAAPGRPGRARGLGRARAQPVLRDPRAHPRRARPSPAARATARAGPFSMASAERTTALLRGAGFAEVRTEEVPVRLAVPDVDEYIALVADTAGPLALALRGLSEAERARPACGGPGLARSLHGRERRCRPPGLALCAVAG